MSDCLVLEYAFAIVCKLLVLSCSRSLFNFVFYQQNRINSMIILFAVDVPYSIFSFVNLSVHLLPKYLQFNLHTNMPSN